MTGTNDLGELAQGWSEVVLKILKLKIVKLNIKNSGDLYESLKFNISGQGIGIQIQFSYNLYGKYVDMGVGKEMTRGNSGNVKTDRKRKEWFSRIFYAQVMTLSELAKKEYGKAAQQRIITTIQPINDLKYNAYRSSDLARNAANYNKQISLPANSSTWVKTK